jgi:polyisoprenoid-binding protein YceI
MEAQMSTVMDWQLDPAHTTVGFAVRHLMISTVKGRFREIEGAARFDPADPTTGSAEVTIRTASVDTAVADRDAHLRSADFFDVEKYPTMKWTSRRVEPLDGKRFRVEGDLTIRDVTRPVTLEVTVHGTARDPWGGDRLGVSATGTLKRSDFGLTWNQALETGGVLVGDEVRLELDAEFVREAARAAA